MLHVLGLEGFLTVDIHHAVDDLQRVARHTDEALYIVFAFVHRVSDNLARRCHLSIKGDAYFTAPNRFASKFAHEVIIADAALVVFTDRVASGVVEHDGVVALHRRNARIAMIRQLDPFEV